VNVELGVDDNGLASLPRSDEVRRAADLVVQELLEVHRTMLRRVWSVCHVGFSVREANNGLALMALQFPQLHVRCSATQVVETSAAGLA
jgi:hypothetical protein